MKGMGVNCGIIGTAGRNEDGEKLTKEKFEWMVEEAKRFVSDDSHLFSGGAAWADHVAVRLYLEGCAAKLTVHLPSEARSVRTAKYYWELFEKKAGIDVLEELRQAKEKGAEITKGGDFKERNGRVAQDASDLLIAFTYGEGDVPKDGGTKDTWMKHQQIHLGAKRVHISLSDEKPKPGGNMNPIDKVREKIEKNQEQLRFILTDREVPMGYRLALIPTVNCTNCIHTKRNGEGMFLRCTHKLAWHNVYIPKMDTYNSFYTELLENYINPHTGEDASEDYVRNLENREATDAKLLRDSLGHPEDMERNDVRRMYSAEVYTSRLPFQYVGFGEGRRAFDNADFCPFHQFNQMLQHGKVNEDLVAAFYRVAGTWVNRIPKFYKDERGYGVPSEIIKSEKYDDDGVWHIEHEQVWVPVENLSRENLWNALFINKKGQDFFPKMVEYVMRNWNCSWSQAKKYAWRNMAKFTPQILMRVAEHNTDWKRIPHPAAETAVNDARRVLILAGEIPGKKAHGMTDSQIFVAYRKFVLQQSQMHQLPRPHLEKGERLAMLDGIWAVTPKGTVISRKQQEQYTNSFYIIGMVDGKKMSAVEWNQLSEEVRRDLLGVEEEGFHIDENTTWADSLGNEEAYVDWAIENRKRAEKMENEFIEAVRKSRDDEFLNILNNMVHQVPQGPRRCAKCGQVMAHINTGSFCFKCGDELEKRFKVDDISVLIQEEIH